MTLKVNPPVKVNYTKDQGTQTKDTMKVADTKEQATPTKKVNDIQLKIYLLMKIYLTIKRVYS